MEPNNKLVKATGIMFLFSLFFPLLNWAFILSRLTVSGGVQDIAENMMKHEHLYRLSIANELVLAVSVVITAVLLYIILSPVNKFISLLALSARLMEAFIITVFGLIGFTGLLFMNENSVIHAFSQEEVKTALGFFFNIHTSLTASFPMLFIGIGLTLYNYLFFKSKCIPCIISGFGMLSYTLIFLYAVINLLSTRQNAVFQMICWSPSIVFEIIIGIWLLVKGAQVKPCINTV